MESPAKIVVLDGYTLNPGDLSWDALRQLGSVTIHDRTPPEQIVERSRDARMLLTNKTPISAAAIQALPALQYIGVLATGVNVVDIEAAKSRGIIVTNIPAYGTRSVAQTTFALLLELTQHVGLHNASVFQGKWTRCIDWSYTQTPLVELDGLTMGIVGLGAIGRAVAHLSQAFGMRIIASSRSNRSANDIRAVDIETLFKESDVVSLHCPLTPETRGLVNAQRLTLMKPSALLLNTARGALIDEPALATALNEGRIAGAGLDVLSSEPPQENNPLLRAKNCIITPHIAWATKAARSRLLNTAVENARAFLKGSPVNVVT